MYPSDVFWAFSLVLPLITHCLYKFKKKAVIIICCLLLLLSVACRYAKRAPAPAIMQPTGEATEMAAAMTRRAVALPC